MTPAAFVVDTDALHAYVDGQLTDAQRTAVDAYLAAHPEAAALTAQWAKQNDALSALFSGTAKEAVPARLNPHRIAESMRSDRLRVLRTVAATLVIVAAAGSVGWYMRGVLWQEDRQRRCCARPLRQGKEPRGRGCGRFPQPHALAVQPHREPHRCP